MIKRIISGGQTGADLGGLYAASTLNIPTGGWACKGWLTEDGPQQELLQSFGLTQAAREGYPYRTELNVEHSEGTLLFGDPASPGSKLTMELCERKKCNKPLFIVNWAGGKDKADTIWDGKDEGFQRAWVLRWIKQWGIETLNVAGNRESVMPGIQVRVFEYLCEMLSKNS